MKYTTYYVKQLEKRKGKPWHARAKYKDVYGKLEFDKGVRLYDIQKVDTHKQFG